MKRKKKLLKEDFSDIFETYLDRVGELLDEYNVPKELIEKITPLDKGIRNAIEEATIDEYNLSELLADNEELRRDAIHNIADWANNDDWEAFAEKIDYYSNWRTIKVASINEEIKFEAFKERLEENPYQLKVV